MLHEISGQSFGFNSSFLDSFGWFWMWKRDESATLMLKFFQALYLVVLFLFYISDLTDVICNTAINADDTLLYSIYNSVFDLWLLLKLDFEPEPDLWHTEDWDRKWLVSF